MKNPVVYFALSKRAHEKWPHAEMPWPTKIGITKDWDNRLRGLQTSSPDTIALMVDVSLPDYKTAKRMEARLHEHFSNERIRGEWFRISENQVYEAAKAILAEIVGAELAEEQFGNDEEE